MLNEEWACDLGPGVRVAATIGGILTLDFAHFPSALAPPPNAVPAFEAEIAAMRVRVQVANALALSIHSATIELQNISTGGFRVTHEDLMHFHSTLSGFSSGAGLTLVPGEGYLMPRHRAGYCPDEVLLRASELLDGWLCHNLGDAEKVAQRRIPLQGNNSRSQRTSAKGLPERRTLT